MKFLFLGSGQYFPPILPNGHVFAVPVGRENQIEVFCLESEGITGTGIKCLWSEILGFYYNDDYWEIIVRNYLGRSMRFRRGMPCVIVLKGSDVLTTRIQGYPVPICLMNRIAFEQQRGRTI